MYGNMVSESFRLFHLALAYLEDRKRSRATVREFRALGPEACAHLLGDAGLAPSEFDRAMGLPFASEDLLTPAMRSVGIDPAEFAEHNHPSYRELCRTCMSCDHRMRCRSDLGNAAFLRTYRDFCPNSIPFDALAASRGAVSDTRPN